MQQLCYRISKCIKKTFKVVSALSVSCFGIVCVEDEKGIEPEPEEEFVCLLVTRDEEQAKAPSRLEDPELCRFCGGNFHIRKDYPARHTKCNFCKAPGHFRCVCENINSSLNGSISFFQIFNT